MEEKEKKSPKEKAKPVVKDLNCKQFCGQSGLSRAGRRYLTMKYGKETKSKTAWSNIIKKDKVI